MYLHIMLVMPRKQAGPCIPRKGMREGILLSRAQRELQGRYKERETEGGRDPFLCHIAQKGGERVAVHQQAGLVSTDHGSRTDEGARRNGILQRHGIVAQVGPGSRSTGWKLPKGGRGGACGGRTCRYCIRAVVPVTEVIPSCISVANSVPKDGSPGDAAGAVLGSNWRWKMVHVIEAPVKGATCCVWRQGETAKGTGDIEREKGLRKWSRATQAGDGKLKERRIERLKHRLHRVSCMNRNSREFG